MDSQIFKHPSFGEVRTAGTPDEPLFCLADVCKAVELTNPSAVKARLDKEDTQLIDLHALNSTEGSKKVGNTLATFITESGFYDVILQSSSPRVKPFRKWVTSEVLPSIRKRGGYMAASVDESPEQILARALLLANDTIARKNEELKKAQEKLDIAQETLQVAKDAVETSSKEAAQARQDYLAEIRQRIKAEQLAQANAEQVRQLQPYADYAKEVLTSTSTFSLTMTGKDLGFPNPAAFLAWCHEKGLLFRQSGKWIPTSKYTDNGYFVIRTYKWVRKDNTVGTKLYTVITEQGRAFLHSLLDKKGDDKAPATV